MLVGEEIKPEKPNKFANLKLNATCIKIIVNLLNFKRWGKLLMHVKLVSEAW